MQTLALGYSRSGLVDWPLAGAFIAAGLLGGVVGSRMATVLARRRNVPTRVFGVLVIGVGVYIVSRGLPLLIRE